MMPLAIELYNRFRIGKTPEEIADELGIPLPRVEQRLRAAVGFVSKRHKMPEWELWPHAQQRGSVTTLRLLMIGNQGNEVRSLMRELFIYRKFRAGDPGLRRK
jgi:hypothetical protein